MSNKIKTSDFESYQHDQVLIQDSKLPRQRIIYRTHGTMMSNGRIELKSWFIVKDPFDHVLAITDFLSIAVKVYNAIE